MCRIPRVQPLLHEEVWCHRPVYTCFLRPTCLVAVHPRLVKRTGVAYFSNLSDQRLYRPPVDGSGAPAAITPDIVVPLPGGDGGRRPWLCDCRPSLHSTHGRSDSGLSAGRPSDQRARAAVRPGTEAWPTE